MMNLSPQLHPWLWEVHIHSLLIIFDNMYYDYQVVLLRLVHMMWSLVSWRELLHFIKQSVSGQLPKVRADFLKQALTFFFLYLKNEKYCIWFIYLTISFENANQQKYPCHPLQKKYPCLQFGGPCLLMVW